MHSKTNHRRPSWPGALPALRVHLALLACALLTLTSCNALDNLLDKLAPPPAHLAGQEQGYVQFDDTGNILVVMNNLEFNTNPLFSEASYIGVWVYKPGADARSVCCYDGFESLCTTQQENACMIGVGFSNDLGFGGTFYLHLHPPTPFPKYASNFHMPVYVADKEGIPQNYQGEYNTFSSPVNTVGDRERYELYLGVYYSAFDDTGTRPVNKIAEVSNDLTYYSAVRPDYISPVIPIESRFFRQSAQDPRGSWYPIPHLASWSPVLPDASLDLRGVVINEIGIDIGGSANNDFVELYNTNNYAVDLTVAGGSLMRDSGCTLSTANITQTISLLGKIPAKGYFVVTRSSATAAVTNVNQFWDTSNNGNISAGYCIILANSKKSPTSAKSSNVIDFAGFTTGTDSENGSQIAVFPVAGQSVGRCPNGQDTNMNAADFAFGSTTATPGAANTCP